MLGEFNFIIKLHFFLLVYWLMTIPLMHLGAVKKMNVILTLSGRRWDLFFKAFLILDNVII